NWQATPAATLGNLAGLCFGSLLHSAHWNDRSYHQSATKLRCDNRACNWTTFKTYGFMSTTQAITFLGDFKLGHYMKIPPKSMFIVQLVDTVVASLVSFCSSWWMLTTTIHISDPSKLPDGSPWTCPVDDAVFN
ncbi:oligopeptide transporter, partial [Asimina triloba]